MLGKRGPARGPSRRPRGAEDDAPALNLQSLLAKAINATAGDDGWTTLGAIGNHLARSHPSWDPRTFGHTKLGSLVSDQPYLETRPAGNHLEVALKQTRNVTKKAPTTPTRKRTAKRPAKAVAKKD